MAFLALANQKTLFALQKNILEQRKQHMLLQVQIEKQIMDDVQQEYKQNYTDATAQSAYEEDCRYLEAEHLEEAFTLEADNLDAQVTMMSEMITSLSTQVNTDLKAECKLNLASGG